MAIGRWRGYSEHLGQFYRMDRGHLCPYYYTSVHMSVCLPVCHNLKPANLTVPSFFRTVYLSYDPPDWYGYFKLHAPSKGYGSKVKNKIKKYTVARA